jgi:hypothetical protein
LANLDGIKAGMLLPGHGDPWTGGVAWSAALAPLRHPAIAATAP